MTRLFDCSNGPSNRAATTAIYESGAVVCAIIPKVIIQRVENTLQIVATRVNKVVGAKYMDLEYLANETGGEVLANKPEKLDTTFQTLIDHLRSRYNLAFVSTNKQRDGLSKPDAVILHHAGDIWRGWIQCPSFLRDPSSCYEVSEATAGAALMSASTVNAFF
jgi:hypothetical protein